ncbi:MAG: polysaccharide deacetylase family protein [Spirochaetales bacterium]|nr:polysaccharide deacetylase family protein [Spirochaetales bacterium]
MLTLLTLVGLAPYAQVQFGDLDLNASSELLFSATSAVPGLGEYRTLFLADIPAAELRQLSVFPERMLILNSTGQIQIQNRFGIFRDALPSADDTPPVEAADGAVDRPPRPYPTFEAVRSFPAFVRGNEIQTGKTIAVSSSPDGSYLTYMVATSPGYGEIRLFDTASEEETTVSRDVELALDEPPLRWSDDSSFFVYQKGNELYYFSLEQYTAGRTLNETLRHIGPGTVAGTQWRENNTLYYVSGSLVYRILGVEFFARSLYQDLLTIGTIVGKLPHSFDPNFDDFWISPDGQKILVVTEGRGANVFFLQADDYLSTGDTLSLPYLYLPRNTRVRTVLWSPDDVVTLLAGSIRHGESSTAVYRIDLEDEATRSRFVETSDEGVLGFELSPDGSRALVWTDDGASIRRYSDWEEARFVEHRGVVHAQWYDATTIVIAGRHIVERVDLSRSGEAGRELLTLSSVEDFGYSVDDSVIRARSGGRLYEFSEEGWTALAGDELGVVEAGVASDEHRVYLENLSRGSYRNMVMVRNIASFGTVPLFPRPQRQYEPFPDRDDPVDLTNFSHGSRIRRREVSLVFNAIDSVAGLTEVLNTLSEYDVRATFFLNGDFIRRHPGAVREIADSGHEVGSLFYTYFDMSSSRFQINAEFIKQGLARNEDEYFDVTGRELTLLWHAPFYFVSPIIIAASRQMNYAYIGRDVDSLDWVPKRDENGVSRLYRPTAQIIEAVMEEKRPGSIIAMTIGRPGDDRPDGGRDDYLFQRLDVLINGLIERGYEIVPVSTLMENAR